MPTMDQLDANRRFDRMFGLSESDHYGDEHLSSQETRERKFKTEAKMKHIRESDKGEVLGHLQWDEELQDLKFTPVSKSEIEHPKS